MESDFVSPTGVVYPQFLTGRIVRSVLHKGQSVSERFAILLNPDLANDHYLLWHGDKATIVDVRHFAGVPGWDPALVYSRPIPGLDADDIEEFFFGNLEAETKPVVRDLRHVKPMDAATFWRVLDAGPDLEGRLGKLPLPQIEAFARQLFLCSDALNDETIARRQSLDLMLGTDSFLAWRLAVLARGEKYYSSVLRGDEVDPLPEDEWKDGDRLIDVAERAAEATLGRVPEFIQVVEDHYDGQGEYLRGDGTVDLRPGPRTAAAMFGRGLLPNLLGSRFIVSRSSSAPMECVAIQHIDPDNEALHHYLTEAATTIAESMDGVLATAVEFYDTHTDDPIGGTSMFNLRRRWRGTLPEYLTKYRLEPGSD